MTHFTSSVFRTRPLTVGLLVVLAFGTRSFGEPPPRYNSPTLVKTQRIWDSAPHNAFTDLVRWRDHFYCAFREGQTHAGNIGKLRIIRSADGDTWQSAGLLAMDDYDLRDAALSVMPDGQLMVLGGAQQTLDTDRRTGTFVSISTDGTQFSPPQIVIAPGRWLWRITWHEGTAYGVAYGAPDDRQFSSLLRTTDGIHYETVTDQLLGQGDWPTEARLRFDKHGTCYCLHRRDGPTNNSAMLGSSIAPYVDWTWTDLGVRLGGPNFILLADDTAWLAAGRLYDADVRTELTVIDAQAGSMQPILRLPSGGDTSYPGMVWHEDLLWISYYSSHEGKANIYLAKIRFDR